MPRYLFQGQADSNGRVGPTLQKIGDRDSFNRKKADAAEAVYDLVSPLSMYAGDAEAGFKRAAPFLQKLASKLTRQGLTLDEVRKALVKDHGASLLPNGVVVEPTPVIKHESKLPSGLSYLVDSSVPSGEARLVGNTIKMSPDAERDMLLKQKNLNHELTHWQARNDGLPMGNSGIGAVTRKGYQDYAHDVGEILAKSSEQQVLGVPLEDQLISRLPMDKMIHNDNLMYSLPSGEIFPSPSAATKGLTMEQGYNMLREAGIDGVPFAAVDKYIPGYKDKLLSYWREQGSSKGGILEQYPEIWANVVDDLIAAKNAGVAKKKVRVAAPTPRVETPPAGPLSLINQVKRALRRDLTDEELEKLSRAEEQGYNAAGWHYGNFQQDLPDSFPSMGERAAYHIDLTPYGSQARARSMLTRNYDPDAEIKLVVARMQHPVHITDGGINDMGRGDKRKYLSSGSNSAVYPNTGEMSYSGVHGSDLGVDNLASSSMIDFVGGYNPKSTAIMNPSGAMFNPGDIRLFDAEFDPEMVGKPGYKYARGGAVSPLQQYAEGGGVRAKPGKDGRIDTVGKGEGLDIYGKLYDSLGVKGTGYFGLIPAAEGYSGEISGADESGDYPLMVPTLSKEQLDLLLSGEPPTSDIYDKARSWADYRRSNQLSPFHDGVGLHYPLPTESN